MEEKGYPHMAHEQPEEAWKHIEDARRKLQQYLAQDNMMPDDDVYNGWVKSNDVKEEIEKIKQQQL